MHLTMYCKYEWLYIELMGKRKKWVALQIGAYEINYSQFALIHNFAAVH